MEVHDAFIRPSVGDFLVVIWLYCSFKSFLNTRVLATALVTLLIAYPIEVSQYFHLIYDMVWGDSHLARAILGTTFQWSDLLMYTLGIGLVLGIERARLKYNLNKMYQKEIMR
jgi:hypothetical protein